MVSLDDHHIVIAAKEKIEADKYGNRIFVYGTEIHDLLSVDYEAVSMLNVSATQALATHVKALEQENAALKAKNEKLQSQNNSIQSDVDKLKASVETLQQIMQSKAEK